MISALEEKGGRSKKEGSACGWVPISRRIFLS